MLAHLAALRDVRDAAQELIDLTVSVAGANGAGGEAIGKTLGVSQVAVRKKWPDAVAGVSGPRKPEFTTLGSDAWTGQPDVPAEQDWLVRARVRLRQDLRNTAWTIDRTDEGEKLRMVERYAHAGEEYVMVMRGRAGTDVTLNYWSTEEPPKQALLADNHQLQVLEVLAAIPPWAGVRPRRRRHRPDARRHLRLRLMTADRTVFRALSEAMDKADAHPESDLLQRRAKQLMASWITWLQEHAAADVPASERLRGETDTAAATVSEVATREGARALEAGELTEAASHWRVAAVREDREAADLLAEALDQEPVMLRLIELYLRMNKPNLALAWCTIAADEGWPIDQVHPLMHRAWQMLSPEHE